MTVHCYLSLAMELFSIVVTKSVQHIFKFSKYQSVEYFIFAGLMAVASVAFMLLAIFYYEYVPEGAYDEGTV